MKIVIVDDEPKIRNGISKLLSPHEGWDVTGVFEDARTALDFMDENDVDVLLTDIKMPEISGLELIRELREKQNNMNIVILSGYSNFSYAQKAIELGVIRYLTKPTNPKEIIAVLQGIEAKIKKESGQEPEENSENQPESQETEITNLTILKAIKYIERNYKNKITLKNMADELYITPNYLCELFKKHTGKNLSDYIIEFRMKKAKMYLNQLEYKVSDVADMVGFGDAKYFSSTFKKMFGMTPLEYRNKKL